MHRITMKQLLFFPYNGNALEALGCIGKEYELMGFVDDTPQKQGKQANGFTVFSRDAFTRYPESKVLAIPGSPTSYLRRTDIITGLKLPSERFQTIIHPQAFVSPLAEIGVNVLIMAGVVITANACIGDNVGILPNTVIHHDVVIGDYTLIGSHVVIAGNARIGTNCYIGSGSCVKNNVIIGDRALVGMGSNVLRPVAVETRVAGNPARELPGKHSC